MGLFHLQSVQKDFREKESLKGKKEISACNFISAALLEIEGEKKEDQEKAPKKMY